MNACACSILAMCKIITNTFCVKIRNFKKIVNPVKMTLRNTGNKIVTEDNHSEQFRVEKRKDKGTPFQ